MVLHGPSALGLSLSVCHDRVSFDLRLPDSLEATAAGETGGGRSSKDGNGRSGVTLVIVGVVAVGTACDCQIDILRAVVITNPDMW
jgi:hypothetical protein